MSTAIRVATVQYPQRRVASFDEFARAVESYVGVAAAAKADFVVLPELFTLQLLSMANRPVAGSDAVDQLARHTEPFKALLRRLAADSKINVVGGSHLARRADGTVRNVCYVALRDGRWHEQEKLHPTPDERRVWGVTGGSSLSAIDTDRGPVGVLICYDSEFPELPRRLVDEGAKTLFVPYCTDDRNGHLRVRYCCHARAIENQCYVALAGNVGFLPGVENMDMQYGESAILTPCDFPFARDGIAAAATANVEAVTLAELDLAALDAARAHGSVRNLADRRPDLYRVEWSDKSRR